MKVTKAIITAAGRGTRFLPAVKVYAKELIPLLDRAQIQHLVEELIGAGITEICIVHRHGDNSIKRYFSPDPVLTEYLKQNNKSHLLDSLNFINSQVKFKFIPQSRHLPYGNGSPILAAKSFIGTDPFVYLWGDDFTFEPQLGHFVKQLTTTFEKYSPAVVVGVQNVPHAEIVRYGSMKYLKDSKFPHQVESIIEKPKLEEAPSDVATGGRYVVSAKIVKVLQQTAINRGELWFADAVNTLAHTDVVLTENYADHGCSWTTTGDPANWLKVNLELAKKDPRFHSLF